MIADKIKEICSEKRMTIPQLAEKIGMSKGFYTTLKNNTLRVDTLLKIAEVLEVPVNTFFDIEQLPSDKEINTLEIEILESQLDTLKERLELNKELTKHLQNDIFIHKYQMKIAYDYLFSLEGDLQSFLVETIKLTNPDISIDKLLEEIRERDEYRFIQFIRHIRNGMKFLIKDMLAEEHK